MMSYEMRDLVGYGKNPPHAAWPGGARLAVNIVINYEEGGEYSPVYGDSHRELFGEAAYPIPATERDLANESIYEYGSRVGIWRVMRILAEYGIQATVFATGAALERNPGAAKEIASAGYDFVGHGYRWEIHWGKPRDEERADIAKVVDAIGRTTGQTPVGWCSRYASSINTREILQELGFIYDSTSYNDDLPYWVEVGGRPFLIIPYAIETNDIRYWRGTFSTGNDFFTYLKDAVDVLYREGSERPKMLSIGLHPRIIGRPGRAAGLERFLEYLVQKERVWVTRRIQIAEHWRKTFRPDGSTPV
jgi:allantoinase